MKLSAYAKEVARLALVPLSYRIGKPLMAPPVVGFNLTTKCNCRCKMCNFWKRSKNENELTKKEIFKILDDVKEIGARYVSFAAEGEVFTREDACEIFNHAKDVGLEFAVNTNGIFLPEEFVARIHELKPYSIIFGLDTIDPENYVRIRGVKDGFSKVIDSIERLQKAGYDAIAIGAVILDNNLEQLLPLADLGLKKGLCAIRFTAFSPYGFGVDWSNESLAKYRDPAYLEKLKIVINQLIEHKSKHGLISNSVAYLSAIVSYYESGFKYYPRPCMVGYNNIQIMATGEMAICSYRGPGAVVGNAKQFSVKELWFSDKAAEERVKIKHGDCPTCWLSCFAENNMRFAPKTMIKSNMEILKRSLKYRI